MPDSENMHDGDRRPVPDPTLLTTAAVTREIGHLREFIEEKFRGVQTQFDEKQRALDAALAAQKEAVGKSEESASKQFDSIRIEINDLKDRQNRSEGSGAGRQDSGKLLFAVIGAVIGLLGVALAVVMAIRKG